MITALALLFGLILIVSGCSSAGPSGSTGPAGPTPPEALAGTSWKAVAVAGRSTVAGREPTLAFDATEVRGSGGCNQFGGEYDYDGGQLTFGEMPMTLMGCDEPIGSLETDFLKVLGGGVTVSIDDGGRPFSRGPAARRSSSRRPVDESNTCSGRIGRSARRSDDRARPGRPGRVRKVRAPQRRVAGNARPPRGEDQCHSDDAGLRPE